MEKLTVSEPIRKLANTRQKMIMKQIAKNNRIEMCQRCHGNLWKTVEKRKSWKCRLCGLVRTV